MKRLFIASFIFVMGCAGAVPKTVTYDNLNKMQNVSCISLIGENVQVKGVGTTVFTNKTGEVHVNWKIDKYLEDLVRDRINKTGRMKYVDIDYSYAQFKKVYNYTKVPFSDFDAFDVSGIQNELSTLAKQYDLDSIIIIIRDSHETPNTSQYVSGCSIFRHSFLGVNVATKIYFSGNMSLIDLTSMSKVAALPLWTHSDLGGITWKDNLNAYSENDLQKIENTLKSKLNELLPMMLSKMGVR